MNAPQKLRTLLPNLPKSRIPELDGLRGIAILLVLLYHYISIPPGQPPSPLLQGLFAIGWSGVDLFFVLSGFLIGGILLDVRQSPNYFKVFYGRRFYRIVPLYYLWIGIYFIAASFWSNPETWRAIPIYVFFLQNSAKINHAVLGTAFLGGLWSLAVEEQFYLIIPSVIRFLSRRGLLLILWSAIICAPVLRALLHEHLASHPAAPYMLTPCRADSLAMGVLLALGWRNERLRAAFYRFQTLIYGTCLVLFCAFLYLAVWKPSQYSLTMYSWGFSVVDAFFACLLAIAVMVPGSRWAAFCRLSFLAEIGRVSYCLYVIHAVVDLACHELFFQSLPRSDSLKTALVSVLAAALSYGLAALSWRFFEHPLLRKGHALKY